MVKQISNNQQAGFTLIELIMVIVVLGALAVTALPRYVDLQTEADQAAVDGVAGALGAGAATNLASCLMDVLAVDCLNSGAPAAAGAATAEMDDCDDVAGTILGGMPANYTITPAILDTGAIVVGTSVTCTVTGPAPNSLTSTFNALTTP